VKLWNVELKRKKQGITYEPNKKKKETITDFRLSGTELAKEKALERELTSLVDPPKPKGGKLKLENLPKGVSLKPGYDHRGHCYEFSHEQYGYLGKAVLSNFNEQTLIQVEVSTGENAEKRKKILTETVDIIKNMIETNFVK
jgi:hypothetical protein